ncbi:DUF7147 family protein [Desertibacillus haloalkaliphilus]|uniref:DUF7147 family protein n=1 Tax=Desertibacillus haloalkaliphilus TaxID=1328930 RepID=UPI001C27657E|nr:methylthioribose kinase [Desertibacillus haloalkaliphilus]MBU8907135.1 methylthioribose kinase [Desertibacillus haloalkaliphilus]
MIQRFIELGEGLSDLYELIELARTNSNRIHRFIRLNTTINERPVTSLVVVLQPASPGKLQPLYICREGVPQPEWKENKRYNLFAEAASELKQEIVTIDVKPSSVFNERELYYQYLTGILRMNNYIPALS